MVGVGLGVGVPVDKKKIGPAVVVKIQKHRAPTQVLRVESETGGVGDVIERAVAVVAVDRCSVVGRISLENVELALAIVIPDRWAHAGLRAAVFSEGPSRC